MGQASTEARAARATRDRERNAVKRETERLRREAAGLPAVKPRVRKPRSTFASEHIQVKRIRHGKQKVDGVYFFDLLVGGVFLTKWFKFDLYSGSVQPPSRNRWRPTTIVNGYGDDMQKIVLAALEKAIGEELGYTFRFPEQFQFPRKHKLTAPEESDADETEEIETEEIERDEPVAAVVRAEDPTTAACRRVLTSNPGVTPARFAQLAADEGVKRAVARGWLDMEVRCGRVSIEPNEDGALRHTLAQKEDAA
jgi:hypothetical protein